MFLRILKADLKHKPLTNFILFVFIALAVMFIASGANNVITVLTAQEDFYDRAGVADYYSVYLGESVADGTIESEMEKLKNANSCDIESGLATSPADYESATSDECEYNNYIMAVPLSKSNTLYFDSENNTVDAPPEGEIYVPQKLIDDKLFSLGEKISITLNNTTIEVTVSKAIKDALFGAESMGMSRILLSDEDYRTLSSDAMADAYAVALCGFRTDNEEGLVEELSKLDYSVGGQFSRSMLNMVNYMSIIIAGLLVVLSICLILIFMLVLNYTVRFTLSQEFREIGVMKAVGLDDGEISKLYLIKYFTISITAAVLGFALSIPFGKILLRTLSETIVIENRDPWGINLACTFAALAAILLFCRSCMKKVEKISPVDAVRNGAGTDNGNSKLRLHLGSTRMNPSLFLPLNDILSDRRHYLVMGASCMVCLLLILVMANTANTMGSSKVLSMVGYKPCDLVCVPKEINLEKMEETKSEIDGLLDELNIQGRTFYELMYSVWLENGDRKTNVSAMKGVGTTADEYDYIEGSAPTGPDEIALSPQIAEILGVGIGDTITLCNGNEERQLLVSGFIQTMFNLGKQARLGDNMDDISLEPLGSMGIQILFDEPQTEKQLEITEESLREKYIDGKVHTAAEEIDIVIGGVSSILELSRTVIAVLMLSICVFVTALLEMSITDKEKGEIALMKAIGFSNGYIIRQHVFRMVLDSLPAMLVAELLSQPVAQMTTGIAFRTMGLTWVEFVINPVENYIIWPLAVLAAVAAATAVTSLSTLGITAGNTADIE